MSTTSTNTESAPVPYLTLAATARALVIGLGWAALMLLVLGLWMRAKYSTINPTPAIIFLSAAGVAAALAAWQAFTLWGQKVSPDEKANMFVQQRRLFSLIFMAGGLGLIGMAFYLGMGKKPDATNLSFLPENLGESIGVLFFGLAALASGYMLSLAGSGDGASPVQFLADKVQPLKLAMLVLAIASLGGAFYLWYTNRVTPTQLEPRWLEWLPEIFALAFLSMLFVACFLWLNAGALDDFGIRLFVLVFGGALGLILFCHSIGRIAAWRQDIVFGGLTAWQGASAHRFWTVFYLQFAALVVMFASFNLARADIRSNVHLRRVMFGYDAIVQVLLLFEILLVGNIFLTALMPQTYDWTKSRGAYSLSDASKNFVANLKGPAHVVLIMPQNDPVYRDVHNLLDNCRSLTTKLTVETLNPDAEDTAYRALTRQFPKIQPEDPRVPVRGILIINGPKPLEEKHNIPYAFVSDQKLATEDFDPRAEKNKRKRIFKGEEEIIKEFRFLVQGKNRKIYVLQGNEAPDVNGDEVDVRPLFKDGLQRMGLQIFVERLKRDNYEVFGLNFGKKIPELKPVETKIIYLQDDDKRKGEIPSDCDTLVVVQTPKALPIDVVQGIERYMERDGKLLLFLDVITDPEYTKLENTGLEPMLKRFGVEVTDGYALAARFGGQPAPATSLLAIGAKSTNPLGRQFAIRGILMPDSARVLKTTPGGNFTAEAVLQLEDRADRRTIVENEVAPLKGVNMDLYLLALQKSNRLDAKLNREPVTVGVAVSETRKGEEGKDKDSRPRLVVVGDAEFIGNRQLMRSPQQTNYSFALSALEWMAERENIGAQPKVQNVYTLDQSVDTLRMIILPGWLMFVTLIALGISVWVIRRR